jgi:hypothetical protein
MDRQWAFGSVVIFLLASFLGCATCDHCDLHNFSVQGGKWQRSDPRNGAVGSIFAPAGGPTAVAATPSPHVGPFPYPGEFQGPTLNEVPEMVPELIRPPEPTLNAD